MKGKTLTDKTLIARKIWKWAWKISHSAWKSFKIDIIYVCCILYVPWKNFVSVPRSSQIFTHENFYMHQVKTCRKCQAKYKNMLIFYMQARLRQVWTVKDELGISIESRILIRIARPLVKL